MTTNQSNTYRIALITGGSAGLGRVLAEFLAAQGYHLLITGRNADALGMVAQQIRDKGGAVEALAGDVSDSLHRKELADLVATFGRLDLLVNNASTLGPLPMPELVDLSPTELQQILAVNTIAPLALVQELRPWLANGAGLVVNITSDAAVGGYPGWGGYGTSKAALELLSRTLAAELGDEGIAVVVVDPGDMRTQMHQDAFLGEDISDRPLPDVTVPFWAWLLGQEPAEINGQRFQAQAEMWAVKP